ncbi:MAG: dolichyl-phosphate beta-D-mannosyltransferase [Myxococcales bacterium]|nr:dolichyl-phosphate beta-D-mannosyltransferase [Myxococcales bacterium]
MKPLIVTPTYNEADNINRLFEGIFSVVPDIHVLVVDDNSPDGTGAIADERAASDPRVHVLHREGKLGLGTAYIAGFKWALERDYTHIFEMDADLSHQPKYLPDFLKKAEDHQLVLGSRALPGGGTEGWGMGRKVLSRGGTLYTRTILWLPYTDLTGGFKCFHREVLESIDLDSVQSEGYAFQIELTWRAHRRGFKVGEVPIIFPDRTLGNSKMSKNIFWEAVTMVWKLRFAGYPKNS